MKVINLWDYNVSHSELVAWCKETGVDVYAMINHGGNGTSASYGFVKDEDLVVFKLKYKPRNPDIVGYKSKTTIDAGHYYCPYIPLIK